MSSHIPLALSLLGTFASHYYPLALAQNAATSAPPPPPPPPSLAPAPAVNSTTPATSANNNCTSTSTSNNTLCETCHLRPKFIDGGKTHPYCSKTCARNASNKTSMLSNSSTSGDCDFCHKRPKYTDGTKVHDYCSKTCARQASGPKRKLTSGAQPAPAACQAPGCTELPMPGGVYCSSVHKHLADSACLMCSKEPQMSNSHFCSQACNDAAERKVLLEVPSGHATFRSVADQFEASWRHAGTTCPPVRRVYKIVFPAASLAKYNAYRAAVEAKGQFLKCGRSEGNENRRWHGTKRECNLGDQGHTQLCTSPSCSLCCIIRTSYDISLWGKKTGWGRFGKGIYTSSTSSKSNDYSQNECISDLKAILLNKVVVGKGRKLLHDNTSLTAPPSGYDSVLAEKGGSLNYDELVVYSNDAIRPSFLVMYES